MGYFPKYRMETGDILQIKDYNPKNVCLGFFSTFCNDNRNGYVRNIVPANAPGYVLFFCFNFLTKINYLYENMACVQLCGGCGCGTS